MLNRRALLATGVASVAVPPLVAIAQGGPAAATRLRRDVSLPTAAGDLAKYRNAVAQLVALPSADPRQWTKLAQQHQDYCPHSNWWFLPWHRAYLFYFERVCQDILKRYTWVTRHRCPFPWLITMLKYQVYQPGHSGLLIEV